MLALKYLIRYPLFLLFPVIYLIGKINKNVIKPDSKKILIIHFGGTGDILMCTPALRLLKRNYPSSEVRFIVSDRLAVDVLERNQNVDEVIFFQQYEAGEIKNIFLDIKRSINGKGKNKGVEHWIPPTDGILRNTNLLDVLATKTIPETKGLFDFPKNVDLIKIICSFSDFHKTDIILDFFSGSATTAHAIMQLNAEDNGNRKFIMAQIPEATDEKSEAYKAGYETIADIGKERIRRVGEKIKAENAGKEGINNLDIGFRVLKIDSSNMKDVYFSPDNTNQSDMFDLASNIKDDRTNEDLLFMVLLDWGIDLSVKIERRDISGKVVYFADANFLAACFEEDLDENFVKALAAEKPRKVVLRDSGFASSSVKVNVEQIFKQANIEVKVI